MQIRAIRALVERLKFPLRPGPELAPAGGGHLSGNVGSLRMPDHRLHVRVEDLVPPPLFNAATTPTLGSAPIRDISPDEAEANRLLARVISDGVRLREVLDPIRNFRILGAIRPEGRWGKAYSLIMFPRWRAAREQVSRAARRKEALAWVLYREYRADLQSKDLERILGLFPEPGANELWLSITVLWYCDRAREALADGIKINEHARALKEMEETLKELRGIKDVGRVSKALRLLWSKVFLAHAEALEKLRATGYLLTAYREPDQDPPDYYLLKEAEPGEPEGRIWPGAKLLGRGGMSDVYEAINPDDGTAVAVKVALPDCEINVREEAEKTLDINHPRAMRAYGYKENEYLILELIRWPRLHEYLAEHGAMGPRAAVAVVLKVIETMEELGIYHRDLDPTNIYYDPRTGEIKIGDFGVSISPTKPHYGHHITWKPRSSSPYQIPESMGAAPGRRYEIAAKNDIYMIGSTLYSALTRQSLTWEHEGQRFSAGVREGEEGDVVLIPYRKGYVKDYEDYKAAKERDDLEEAQRIREKYQLVAHDIPAELYKIIVKATSFDPDDTYESLAEFREELEAALKKLPPDSRRRFVPDDTLFEGDTTEVDTFR